MLYRHFETGGPSIVTLKSMTIPFIMNKVFINKHLFPYFPYLEGKIQQYDWTNTIKEDNPNINHTRKSLKMILPS